MNDEELNQNRNANRTLTRTRAASVFTCVLVVLLLVGMLCVQTTQSLLIIRRSDMQRAKLHQAREVVELAREIQWSKVGASKLSMAVPQSIPANGEPELLAAEVEVILSDAERVERIVVYYPSEKPGEITASWESGK